MIHTYTLDGKLWVMPRINSISSKHLHYMETRELYRGVIPINGLMPCIQALYA